MEIMDDTDRDSLVAEELKADPCEGCLLNLTEGPAGSSAWSRQRWADRPHSQRSELVVDGHNL